jgi:hypothetical protein
MNRITNRSGLLSVLLLGSLLAACGGGGGNNVNRTLSYHAELSNLTNAQPFSPVVVVVHHAGYVGFEAGVAATTALEQLAEGGDTTAFVQAAEADPNVIAVKTVGTGITPGVSETLDFSVPTGDRADLLVTAVSMLTNTNDGFAGLERISVSSLSVGEAAEFELDAYDAGTEANTETAATVPGPAGGGTGFDPARDDPTQVVTRHPGVVSMDDGLPGSALTQAHRFDNPVLQITVTRTQ